MRLSDIFCHVCQVRIADYVAVVDVQTNALDRHGNALIVRAELNLCSSCLTDKVFPIVALKSARTRPGPEVHNNE
jgi:hypothetical protein